MISLFLVQGLQATCISADARAVEPAAGIKHDAVAVLDGLHAEVPVLFEVEPFAVLPVDFGNVQQSADFSSLAIDDESFF